MFKTSCFITIKTAKLVTLRIIILADWVDVDERFK